MSLREVPLGGCPRMAIFPNLRVRRKLVSSKYFHPCLQGRIPVVIISAFLDLEKNISFSDNLLGSGKEGMSRDGHGKN